MGPRSFGSWITPTFLLLILVPWVRGQSPKWFSNPNGQVRTVRQTQQNNCGDCPPGYQREQVGPNVPYCGQCKQVGQSCAPGNVMVGNQCQPCPCPGAGGGRQFGTECRVDHNGQIVCECPPEYSGPNCDQCAPGAVQMNQYPYSCVRVNSTYCPPGAICQGPVPPIIQPSPPPVTGCPITPGPGYGCDTGGCQPQPQPQPQPQQPYPWVPPPPPPPPCPVTGIVGPGPILCPGQGSTNCGTQCGTNCGTQCGTNCGIQCGTNCGTQCGTKCPSCPPPPPPPPPCPPCPVQPCPVQPCPQPYPCPQPCPQPYPCPQCPPQLPCPPCPQPPPCPVQPCPQPCPPCPQPPPPPCPPCPVQPCPNPCPYVPPCPPCPVQPCPNPCPYVPPCPTCPDKPCPNPCPYVPPCPQCPSMCNGTKVNPCICDTRGTLNQYEDRCYCKTNVQGYRCNSCKPGYFGLSALRSEGCLEAWCSGVSTHATTEVHYRTWISITCPVTLTDDAGAMKFDESHTRFSCSSGEAQFTQPFSAPKLFWSLPAMLLGNRLTSYGAVLKFSRQFTGTGTPLGPDNDVIIVGESGAMLVWSGFNTLAPGTWTTSEVKLDETEHWVIFKGDVPRKANRLAMLEVLAHIQRILVRATFNTNMMTTRLKAIQMGTVTKIRSFGSTLVLGIEHCLCPTGYKGLSCESCAEGYFRDVTDMTQSVFGACKLCPCGRNAEGCHISYGVVVCECKPGFGGDKCQDKEVITITLDPFGVRDCKDTKIDFTCTFTTNSKKTLWMKLDPEGSPSPAVGLSSIKKTFTLTSSLGRVKCEIVDPSGKQWAVVYADTKIEECLPGIVIPPKTIDILVKKEFICVNTTENVELTGEVLFYGPSSPPVQWIKEGGSSRPIPPGPRFLMNNVNLNDAGIYMIYADNGLTIALGQVVLVVRPPPYDIFMPLDDPDAYNSTNVIGIGNFSEGRKFSYSNKNNSFFPIGINPNSPNSVLTYSNKTSIKKMIPPILPPLKKPGISTVQFPKNSLESLNSNPNPMQKDQAIEGYPNVIVDPTEIRVKIGESVTLRCNASGEEPMKFYWKSGSNDYIPVHVRVSRGALIFKSVKKEDEGSYYCVAWNNLGQVAARASILVDADKEGSAAIRVPIKDKVPLTLTVSQTNSKAVPGTHAYFDCATNDPSIKAGWVRKAKDGEMELPKNSEVTGNGTLVIYRVQEEDTGTYICRAEGEGQKVQIEVKLGLAPLRETTLPNITLSPKSPVKGRSGDKIRIECSATGYPQPNVTWTKSMEGSEKKLASSEGNTSAYEIVHLTKGDEGKYTCTAINEMGTKSESLSLVVDDAILCKVKSEFRCKSGDQCVSIDDRCDNERDCKDGSDEHHCRKRSRRGLNLREA